MTLPREFSTEMQRLLGDEFPAFEASQVEPPVAGLRVNTLKIAPDELLHIAGRPSRSISRPLAAIPWCPGGFVYRPGFLVNGDDEDSGALQQQRNSEGKRFSSPSWIEQPGTHPYHAAGLYYLQEPSAMAIAELLAPQPGERVLDLCAAPGGKATHLIAHMQDQGLLVANEIHTRRAWELAANLERWGAHNVAITNETPGRLAEALGAFFDKVLVDAPCSGEGMFRKSEAARRDWSPDLVHGCAVRQSEILRQAARLVRPGGLLGYSTCTFNPLENEGVILRFLEESAEQGGVQFELAQPAFLPGYTSAGFTSGRPDWIANRLVQAQQKIEMGKTIRLWPHRLQGEGHFFALMQRCSDTPLSHQSLPLNRSLSRPGGLSPSSRVSISKKPKPENEFLKHFHDFCQANLHTRFSTVLDHFVEPPDLQEARLAQAGSYLYRLAEDLPDLSGLRVIHPGWWLGIFKKNRFEPSHALALGLPASAFQRTIELSIDDGCLVHYLRGEMLNNLSKTTPPIRQIEDGWAVITVDGFPLGWGKLKGGLLKNYYPHGLRQL